MRSDSHIFPLGLWHWQGVTWFESQDQRHMSWGIGTSLFKYMRIYAQQGGGGILVYRSFIFVNVNYLRVWRISPVAWRLRE